MKLSPKTISARALLVMAQYDVETMSANAIRKQAERLRIRHGITGIPWSGKGFRYDPKEAREKLPKVELPSAA